MWLFNPIVLLCLMNQMIWDNFSCSKRQFIHWKGGHYSFNVRGISHNLLKLPYFVWASLKSIKFTSTLWGYLRKLLFAFTELQLFIINIVSWIMTGRPEIRPMMYISQWVMYSKVVMDNWTPTRRITWWHLWDQFYPAQISRPMTMETSQILVSFVRPNYHLYERHYFI